MQHNVFDWSDVDAAIVWPVTIRILVVIDGRIELTKREDGFGLGYVLETLRAPFTWWVRFRVDVARHDDEDKAGEEPLLAYSKPFRFTDPGFNLDTYHQVWFFADRPNENDGLEGSMTDDDVRNYEFRLSDAELKRLAEWMDRGGGVFATGDHNVLGAAMCHRIPRVRSMRRWTIAQDVPPRDDLSGRHETLQPVTGVDPETDTVLQPLELVSQGGPLAGPPGPHPLFQSSLGIIDRFPDHMHEGEVIADGDVQLDWPLDIPGYLGAEYPSVPTVLASGLASDAAVLFHRPRPHVVAYGRTTNPVQPELVGMLPLLVFPTEGAFGFTKQFGLVGVYDGDRAGIGRVVVDSTWHHWLSINIDKIAKQAEPQVLAFNVGSLGVDVVPTAYRKMQAYYRNVVLWLATPAQRRSMLVSSLWGILTAAPPMAFTVADNGWHIGKRLIESLHRLMTPGLVNELAGSFVARPIVATAKQTSGNDESFSLNSEVVQRAIIGGIGSALMRPAREHREMRDRGLRPPVDGDAIRQRALEGASRGRLLLAQSLEEAVATLTAIQASFRATEAPSIDVLAPPAGRRVRVIATKLQLPDPRDPVLIDGYTTATIRVRSGDDVIGARTLERVKVTNDERGAVIDLGLEVGEAEVGPWESLSVEVLAGTWSTQRPSDPDAIRFQDVLHDDPGEWISEHAPARSQAWRLWYRIEDVVGRRAGYER